MTGIGAGIGKVDARTFAVPPDFGRNHATVPSGLDGAGRWEQAAEPVQGGS